MSDPTHVTEEPTISTTDELRQEHAVDHAAQAPAKVTLDSSASPGPGAEPGQQPGQHGLAAHSHGAGAIPDQSRAERPTSFDVADFPMPTGREEDWRFTPVDRLGSLLAEGDTDAGSLTVKVEAPDGVTHREVGTDDKAVGTGFVPADRAAVVAWAGTDKALVVEIPTEAQLTEPVVVRLHGTGGAGSRANTHTVVDAGRFSKAIVVLDHRGSVQNGGNVEVRVGDGAELTVVSLQQWDDDAVHLAQHDILVGRDATVKHVAVSLGGKIVRLSTNVRYGGPGGDATLLGVYFADEGQHLEHRSFVDHAGPHCRSNVVYKGALQGDGAHTVWIGDVLIRAAAEGTDTYELNRNLVLTDGARADSVPNLEIETGEIVGAGHASATGRFDDEQLFYLQARGIPEDEARRLVVRAFFADIVQQIGVPLVQERLMEAIEAELEVAMAAGEAGGTA
ncbi:MAG TPA: Fe-S cluster assembly protein SufD [Actinomycetales bacterium]|jgi:Fe-S cluster assembly protein SufD|nr:Fe-S cluster assembly protein SufD [Actinomycetales bacterium]